MAKEFLVIYEEPADGPAEDDELVLDIHTLRHAFRKQVDVETRVQVDLEGSSDPTGVTGLIVTALGAIVALVGIITFATTYPQEWYDGTRIIGTSLRQLTAALFVIGGLAMIAGTILAAAGRKVRAQGRIEEAHIVSKEPHAHTELH
ncbi:MAG: DUF7139 domain-containing protein [Thermoplasmatota archaeon]